MMASTSDAVRMVMDIVVRRTEEIDSSLHWAEVDYRLDLLSEFERR